MNLLNNWKTISSQGNLDDEFIENNYNKLNWRLLCQHQVISEILLRKYSDRISWKYILNNYKLSIEFINEIYHIFRNIREDSGIAFWKLYFNLVENTPESLSWDYISRNIKCNKQFILTHKDELNPILLTTNTNVGPYVKFWTNAIRREIIE